MSNILHAFLPELIAVAQAVLLAIGSWVAFQVGAFIRTKGSGTKAGNAIAVLWEATVSIVHDIEVTEKAALEAAAKDGQITTAEGAYLKKLALDRLKADLGDQGIAALKKATGIMVGGTLDGFLGGLVERAVTKVGVDVPPPVVQGVAVPR